jgi:hypothetical protein
LEEVDSVLAAALEGEKSSVEAGSKGRYGSKLDDEVDRKRANEMQLSSRVVAVWCAR